MYWAERRRVTLEGQWQPIGMEDAWPLHSTWTDRLCNIIVIYRFGSKDTRPEVERELIILKKLLPPGDFFNIYTGIQYDTRLPSMVSIATVKYVQGAVIFCGLPNKYLVSENAFFWSRSPSDTPCSTSSSSWHCTPHHPRHIWTFGFYTWTERSRVLALPAIGFMSNFNNHFLASLSRVHLSLASQLSWTPSTTTGL